MQASQLNTPSGQRHNTTVLMTQTPIKMCSQIFSFNSGLKYIKAQKSLNQKGKNMKESSLVSMNYKTLKGVTINTAWTFELSVEAFQEKCPIPPLDAMADGKGTILIFTAVGAHQPQHYEVFLDAISSRLEALCGRRDFIFKYLPGHYGAFVFLYNKRAKHALRHCFMEAIAYPENSVSRITALILSPAQTTLSWHKTKKGHRADVI
jgi:hypothetical protein